MPTTKTLINMELSAEEAKELTTPDPGEAPKYPWGLELRLEDDQLAKLGITVLPAVGAAMQMTARVEVTALSARDSQQGGSSKCLTLQVTDMALAADTSDTTAAAQLYAGTSGSANSSGTSRTAGAAE
jgi:hypothetical protein